MGTKKTKALLLIGLSVMTLVSLQSFLPQPPGGGIPQFEMDPPVATEFWVQKLQQPLKDGSTMKMMVKYDPLYQLPSSLDIFYGPQQSYITFYDDGTNADVTSGDGLYTAYIAENIQSFLGNMQQAVQSLTSQGSLIRFTGHTGEVVPTQGLGFDFSGFNLNLQVQVHHDVLTAFNCGSIIKENSLFITDINVVEDLARTNKVLATGNTGNPNGIYTFGNMIKNMAGVGALPGSARKLMKSWIENWTQNVIVNGQLVDSRLEVFSLLIEPWLTKANPPGFVFDPTNWSAQWDATNEAALLENAPFKLTAIVNRIDLRGNASYTGSVSNAGETRFIYTLENIYTPMNAPNSPGMPPAQNFAFAMGNVPVDWRGLNVILEYGNVQKTKCEIKDFAHKWYDLSNMTLGSNAYKDLLETITSTVIDAGAVPGKVNGSAINRIRTNERIFQRTTRDNPGWQASDWEFRQFELDAGSGLFKQVALTNTPMNSANNPTNLLNWGPYVPSVTPSAVNNSNLINWVFSSALNVSRIINEKHSLPPALMAGSAKVDGEYAHYLDLFWGATSTQAPNYHTYGAYTGGSNPTYKDVRRRLSLNTCQGCHAGETQTVFAHVMPLGYGQTARYWDLVPDALGTADGIAGVDTRFTANNGITAPSGTPNYAPPPLNYVKVSAFLTGRTFAGGSMNTLYYLNSPDNDMYAGALDFLGNYATNVEPFDKQFGYNDLERRLMDLCSIISNDCNPNTRAIFTELARQPFALGAH